MAGVALLLVLGLYAATSNTIFGNHPKTSDAVPAANTPHQAGAAMAEMPVTNYSIDSILLQAQSRLTPQQTARLNALESRLKGAPAEEKIHLNHQLARVWHDSLKMFEPYAWYTAEAARLENSENSLTFAAPLFLDGLQAEENPSVKQWKAQQAKDLFERALKINPANDSSQVGMGATLLFGGIAMPMEGIQKIRGVVERDSNNVYAQMTLGQASLLSGQLDKAVDRFKKVIGLQPKNLEAILSLAETYERMGNKPDAILWYQKSLPFSDVPGLREEIEGRIKDLSK